MKNVDKWAIVKIAAQVNPSTPAQTPFVPPHIQRQRDLAAYSRGEQKNMPQYRQQAQAYRDYQRQQRSQPIGQKMLSPFKTMFGGAAKAVGGAANAVTAPVRAAGQVSTPSTPAVPATPPAAPAAPVAQAAPATPTTPTAATSQAFRTPQVLQNSGRSYMYADFGDGNSIAGIGGHAGDAAAPAVIQGTGTLAAPGEYNYKTQAPTGAGTTPAPGA